MKLFDTECRFYTDIDNIDTTSIVDTEVMPCAAWEENGKIIYDAVSGTDDIYAVYVRLDIDPAIDNPLRCIADFPDKESAYKFEQLIRLFLKLK